MATYTVEQYDYLNQDLALGGTPPYRFGAISNLPDGINPTSDGKLVGMAIEVGAQANYSIAWTDAKQATGTATGSNVTVVAPVAIDVSALTAPTVGTAYNQSVSASGGTGAMTYSVDGGKLPPGLTLNGSTGAITGTPTNSGQYSFLLKVADGAGRVAVKQVTWTMVVGTLAVVTTGVTASGTNGTAYSGTVASTGGTAPKAYYVASGALPTGTTLNKGTGAISGTLSAAGTFTPAFRVIDGDGSTVTSAAVTITIA